MTAERLRPGNGFPEEGVMYTKQDFSTMLLSMVSLEYYPDGWSRDYVFSALEYLEGWKMGEEGQACFFKDDNGSIIVAFDSVNGLPPSTTQ